MIHNFDADGFEALYPRYKGGRPPKFTEQQREKIKRIALTCTRSFRTTPGAAAPIRAARVAGREFGRLKHEWSRLPLYVRTSTRYGCIWT